MPIKAHSKKGIVKEVLHEWREGRVHSGKGGPVVKSHKQAVAEALNMARRRGK